MIAPTEDIRLSELERTFWRTMLRAELNRCYFSHLSGRFHRWDFAFKIFLAITTSSTVAGWAIWQDDAQYPILAKTWRILSGASALVALAMPILNLSKKVEWSTSLTSAYDKILSEYELNWAQIETLKPEKIVKALEEGRRKTDALSSLESHFPGTDQKLVRKCQKSIIQKRGLDQ